MDKRTWLAFGLLACVVAAWAAGPGGVRKRAEMSMVVTGTIDIEKSGAVSGFRLDKPLLIPAAVTKLLNQAVPHWAFEPVQVDGQTAQARTLMRVRVIAKKEGEKSYSVRIGSADFGKEGGVANLTVTRDGELKRPTYPKAASRANVSGTVYLLLKVGKTGRVEDVVDEQTNLRVLGSDAQMEQARRLLASTAKATARNWRFNPPTQGEAAKEDHWSVRVPVDFVFDYGRDRSMKNDPEYGTWQVYIPGPVNKAPWRKDDPSDQSPDALAAGGIYPVDSGPKLLTPLTQG